MKVWTLDAALQRCQWPRHFREILSQTILTGLISDPYTASKLINFFTRSSLVPFDYSLRIFDHLHNPNPFTWNTIMRAHFELQNNPHQAITLYKLFLAKHAKPDNYTYPILLQCCAARVSEFEGRELHAHVVRFGFHQDVYVRNTLINLYAICGRMSSARQVFEESPVWDLVSWNTVLAGYVQAGNVEEAERVYRGMPERNTIASNSMIVLFGKKRCVKKARRILDKVQGRDMDMVSWNAMVSCYEQNEMCEEALVLFVEMKASGVTVDEIVVVSVVSACSRILNAEMGRLVHGLAAKVGVEDYVSLKNALIHLYSSCGEIVDAQRIFDDGGVSWTNGIGFPGKEQGWLLGLVLGFLLVQEGLDKRVVFLESDEAKVGSLPKPRSRWKEETESTFETICPAGGFDSVKLAMGALICWSLDLLEKCAGRAMKNSNRQIMHFEETCASQ
ncbi:Pentatricopeptide repeat-containing protein [Vigna angularis]|uniref:Pentatricopeptide repeat-containing protein n=1 Tax=Phaseolus angularis TaxID=3914 RepID=A0A8T0JTG0_PHAAN|nr:Pentatricopeptide repeat-containing protein [Vigna angularis]